MVISVRLMMINVYTNTNFPLINHDLSYIIYAVKSTANFR